ncbi:DUF952 domain-containing protein [Reichenbachiella agariperforans]|uniref:DUF952 domain-containing protein n=1 Tax=Reichenbachiella agariperforans TaxID=156994 RepID=UPI001C088CCD|nr:DUF952 domain-containing protein [Reichenbachiella agariperforans]MBU2912733.1 DUF952 domain-containing protein [Reichenbachiella agariperforans]
MTQEEPILLQCFLSKEGDHRNRFIFYSSRMQIMHKGKSTVIDFDKIKLMQVQTKKLIVALVAGGIGTSLSMMALPLGWYSYNLNLFSIFFFFGLMYWGFIGQKALVIEEKNHAHVFLLNLVNPVILELIQYYYQLRATQQRRPAQVIFHLVEKEAWDAQTFATHYTHPSLEQEGFIHCSVLEELMKSYQRYFDMNKDVVLLAIVPDRLDRRVDWAFVETRQAHFPHVMGPISKSAIWSAYVFRGEENLQGLIQ